MAGCVLIDWLVQYVLKSYGSKSFDVLKEFTDYLTLFSNRRARFFHDLHEAVYASCVRRIMTYGSETMPLLADVGLKFESGEM